MKLLAIDSSGLVATVALLDGDLITAEYTINYKKTHSQTLLPMIDEITEMTELDLSSLDGIAVAGGPGSFTGLRIGSATAKGLGLALDLPLISVPTLDALAFNLCGMNGIVCPMMDARRSQVYTGIYRFSGNEMETLMPQAPMAVEEIAEKINQIARETAKTAAGTQPEEVVLLGDGVPVYQEKLDALLTVPYRIAPPHHARQRAAALAVLAVRYMKEGKIQTAEEHAPDYLRLSQAERERAKREQETHA
ncbi:MAG: tRNA (adenosine(37)-N6)-threonylcarbamoyltransferase complex dimerization subunit type 1 TsaB [Eubacterium sp.]|nr:tRNA (adenosine(37)-N6)-threonylcarbamoyltransferase complex dimerization subunit type 1 TsaB [Eubacterium sp.]